MKPWAGHGLGLLAAVAVLVFVDRSPSDDGGPVALLVLLLAAGLLGALWPSRVWLTGAVLGVTVAAARAAAEVLGVAVPDPHAPHTAGAIAGLLVLVLPALLGAHAGALARRRGRDPAGHRPGPTL